MTQNNKTFTALGLMSGTSTDGIDVAFIKSDGEAVFSRGPYSYYPYDEGLKQEIQTAFGQTDRINEICLKVEELVTYHHIKAVEVFLKEHAMSIKDIDLIGFHGQTITHIPDECLTIQLGDGTKLSKETGIPVIYDFRTLDVEHGGQGAPLVPIYHQALTHAATEAIALLNIGGVANITVIDEKKNVVAFDTGPGNALIDDWIRKHEAGSFDEKGALARSGTVHETLLKRLLDHPYFEKPYPKSLDRNDFNVVFEKGGVSLEDGAATLTAFTIASIVKSIELLTNKPNKLIICGGGRHNDFMMVLLAKQTGLIVESSDDMGLNGDMMEAEAFGYLAIRSYLGLPYTFPETTGCDRPLSGGVKG